jgi:hypothetical protein
MDYEIMLSAWGGFQIAAYIIKGYNYHRDARHPSSCQEGFCNFAHSIYRTKKAKILIGLPFPLDVLYAYGEYRKSELE